MAGVRCMLLQQDRSPTRLGVETPSMPFAIVAERAKSPAVVPDLAHRIENVLMAEPVVRAKKRHVRPRKQRSTATMRKEQMLLAPTALSRPVHEGPVVISLAQFEAERGKRALAQANQVDADGTKDEVSRS